MARVAWAVAALVLAACTQPAQVPPQPGPTAAELAARRAADEAAAAQAAVDARVAAALQAAEAAYLRGYPLITSEVLRVQSSAVGRPEVRRAPPNSFWHQRQGGDGAPMNTDPAIRLSLAWLDLQAGPVIFSHPAISQRYFAFTLHSQWMTELATLVGGRGGKAARVLVSGPGWDGKVPKGVMHVRSPTRHVALIARLQVGGSAADARAVRTLQDRLRLQPAVAPSRGAKGAPVTSPRAEIDGGYSLNDTPRQVIAAMDSARYFDLLARLLGQAAPPRSQDAPLLQQMAPLGFTPGQPFDVDGLEPAVRAAVQALGPRMQALIDAQQERPSAGVHGWYLPPAAEADDLQRAALAAFDWPGPVPRALSVLSAKVDGQGRSLSGAHDYLLRFDKGQWPPVDGPWSIAVVDSAGQLLQVPNTYDRSHLGSGDKLLVDDDGTLRLHVQNLSPGYDRAANWLPTPKGGFALQLRLYAPRTAAPSVLPPGHGDWTPPALTRSD